MTRTKVLEINLRAATGGLQGLPPDGGNELIERLEAQFLKRERIVSCRHASRNRDFILRRNESIEFDQDTEVRISVVLYLNCQNGRNSDWDAIDKWVS